MTTPDNGPPDQGEASPPPARPMLTPAERKHVYRKPPPPTAKAPTKLEPGVEQTARVVQLAYTVFGENLRQGREAAEKLSQGRYHISAAPADLDKAGRRVLDLARELSKSSLDFGERLLDELKDILGPVQRGDSVPAFRAWVGKGAASANAWAKEAGPLKVEVKFEDGAKAKAHTVSINRPKPGVQPRHLYVPALIFRSRGQIAGPAGSNLVASVTFTLQDDLSKDGVVANIENLQPGQAPGHYDGSVCVPDEAAPLGTLTIEILQ